MAGSTNRSQLMLLISFIGNSNSIFEMYARTLPDGEPTSSYKRGRSGGNIYPVVRSTQMYGYLGEDGR